MKVVNIDNISKLSHKTAVTVGMFDGVHLGHRHILSLLLAQSREHDLDPVVVTFDVHPRVVLGKADDSFRQLMTTDERLAALDRMGIPMVALAHFSPEMAHLSACQFARQYLLDRLNVGVLVLGYDNMFGSKHHNDFDQLPALAAESGFAIVGDSAVLQDGSEVSSTRIRQALLAGEVSSAAQMLGSPFMLSGRVVEGRHVGHSLGFPTANIVVPDPYKALPAPGVYAVRVSLDGQLLPAMANVGPCPTFAVNKPSIEVHILRYDGDLYGCELSLLFDQRIRDVSRFDTVDALVEQIRSDRERVNLIYCQK